MILVDCNTYSQGDMSTGSQSERLLGKDSGDELCCMFSIPNTNATAEFLVNHIWSYDIILLIQHSIHED